MRLLANQSLLSTNTPDNRADLYSSNSGLLLNLAGFNNTIVADCTVTNSSGKVLITKTGGFANRDISLSTYMKGYAYVDFSDTYTDGWYMVNSKTDNSITIELAYSADTTCSVTKTNQMMAALGGYSIPSAGFAFTEDIRLIVEFFGKFGATYTWELHQRSTATTTKFITSGSIVLPAKNAAYAAAISVCQARIDTTVNIGVNNNASQLVLLMKSDNSGDTACIGNIALFDVNTTDDNGRVDVGQILGQPPLSENTIAETVVAEMKAEGLGTDVMVEPDEA